MKKPPAILALSLLAATVMIGADPPRRHLPPPEPLRDPNPYPPDVNGAPVRPVSAGTMVVDHRARRTRDILERTKAGERIAAAEAKRARKAARRLALVAAVTKDSVNPG